VILSWNLSILAVSSLNVILIEVNGFTIDFQTLGRMIAPFGPEVIFSFSQRITLNFILLRRLNFVNETSDRLLKCQKKFILPSSRNTS